MTGTAKTEEQEFQKIYKLDTVQSSPPTSPTVRKDMPDMVYRTEKGKFRASASRRSRSATEAASRCWWARSAWRSPRSFTGCSCK
jgi:preprotein translocase subunit SecA